MARKCPKCESISLDYDPDIDLWKCVRARCDYREENTFDNPLQKSILGV